jgi:hypothetical protein
LTQVTEENFCLIQTLILFPLASKAKIVHSPPEYKWHLVLKIKWQEQPVTLFAKLAAVLDN